MFGGLHSCTRGKTDTIETSYGICGDTIKTYDRKQYKILELTDSTLVILYLPERMTIGVGGGEIHQYR